MTSLKEFAEDRNYPKICAICRLPVDIRSEVDDALLSKIGPRLISSWLLEEHGMSCSDSVLYHHRSRGHCQEEMNE